ncbi:hypothetical protein HU200_056616 [Digitaria exilis]|uniref:Poly [ADP-ribose] polymerase n=1 Tax=Digitaria exilis TaxID=1010633 RepID=A0A835AG00_9POAL|nr:hypothetical protein HU200_056616 [Digitaria exilis]
MSARLRVEELRAELQRRGLNDSGNKPALVRRLDAAVRKEEKAAVAAAAANAADGDVSTAADCLVMDGDENGGVNKKRKRSGDREEEGNGTGSLEAAKLEGMSYRELQGLAKSRGLAANGSKKDVMERLLLAPANSADGVQDDKRAPKDGAEKVEEEGDDIYDATLNQTNVGDNNNKFYIIQVLGYNADKLPLGKLSKSTILKVSYVEFFVCELSIHRGYDVLKRISNVISKADRRQLEQLTGEFYTVIPHDFGFRKMREFIIDTPQKLKAKLEMVEALGEIEIATKLLEDDSSDQDDPLYARYKQLHCDFTPLEADSKEYSMFARTGNRMLLWHGSRLSNWTGILSQGLRIAPPEAPVSGYMFGKGVYFADMFSKSANYCYASEASRSGVLLLCEVALGDMNELLNADYDANNLPKGKLSTKGVGRTAPDLSESKTTDDGVVVPLGKPKQEPSKRGSLLYNEYIVYNVDQIRMRYILHVSFNFKRR